MGERLYLDASVLISILAREDDWLVYSQRLDRSEASFTSAISMLEAVIRLSAILRVEPITAKAELDALLRRARVEVLAVTDRTAAIAVDAFTRYGKGRHQTRLNLGDCFSYACAKQHRLTLLYKGDDFAMTDIV